MFYDCTARFMSDLVGNPEDRFSHNEAHIKVGWYKSQGRVIMMVIVRY